MLHFWTQSGPFAPKKFFLENYYYHSNLPISLFHCAKFKKNSSSGSRVMRMCKRRDRQTLFYRTLPAEARDTTSLQQVTGGNAPNLALKRMLGYFLKIQPLKKILQF